MKQSKTSTHNYLYGFPFKLVTDHNPLVALKAKGLKDVGGRLSRWMIFLLQFNFTIQYKPGKNHTNADALSRRPVSRSSDGGGGGVLKERSGGGEDHNGGTEGTAGTGVDVVG